MAFLVIAPASHSTIGLNATGMQSTGTDRYKGTGRRRGFAIVVVTPTFHFAISLDATSMGNAGTDRYK